MIQIVEYTLYTHWASALVNADFSGLDDDDVIAVSDFLADNDELYCVDVEDDNGFTNTHDVPGGLAGDCSTFIFHREFGVNEPETPLQEAVAEWLADGDPDYGPEGLYADLQQGGCQSGMVSELIYYADTLAFYRKHQKEIDKMLYELMEGIGSSSPSELFGDGWDDEDPLARDDMNQNLLAWFGFEETARYLMEA